jgi:hypothetical protein
VRIKLGLSKPAEQNGEQASLKTTLAISYNSFNYNSKALQITPEHSDHELTKGIEIESDL